MTESRNEKLPARPLRRLSVRLVAATLLLSLLVSMAIAAMELWRDYDATQRVLDHELDRIKATHVPLVAPAVWTYDQAQLERSASSLLAIPGVVRIRIEDQNHKTLVNIGQGPEHTETRTYDLFATVRGEPAKAGELYVLINRDSIRGELWEKYAGAFRATLLQLSLATLLMLALFEWMVTRHMRRMATFVSTRTPENLGEPLRLSGRRSTQAGDEIDLLATGLADMQRSLQAAIANLEHDVRLRIQAESQVRELNASLEQRVGERTRELQRAKQSAENVLELTHSAFWAYDLSAPTLWLDERGAALLGLSHSAGSLYPVSGILDGVAAGSPEFARRLAEARARHGRTVGGDHALERMRELGFFISESGPQGTQVGFSAAYKRPSDGRIIWIDVLARLSMEGGPNGGLLGSVQDVTAAKRTEQALAVARDAANAANRAKSDFLANMSHEIRTPLNGLLGMVQLLERSGLNERQRGFVARQRHSADALLRVVNDVLDFSKIEAGQLDIESAGFDLHELLRNTLSLHAVRAEEKGLALTLDLPPETPRWVTGDMLRVGQVLGNLVSNALKFTDVGRVAMRVRLEGDVTDGAGTVCFDVEDTGMGMDEAQIARLFKSFQQADTSISRRFGGTGLGLAISKRLVELMGGRIGARSLPGQGSTFSFTLPLQLGPADPAVAPSPPGASGSPTGDADSPAPAAHALDGLEILLADDNVINQEVARELLVAEGVRVTVVSDGAQAVAAVEARRKAGQPPFAAVLMDIQMPVMDGFAATAALRADPANGALPIIAMTAHGLSGDRERSLAAGMNDHVVKPVAFSALMGALARVLQRPGAQAEAPPVPASAPAGGLRIPAGLRIVQVDDALSRLSGRGDLYLRLVQVFVAQGEQLATAYRSADTLAAQAAAAHRLKGTAGSLGMILLHELATDHEQAIRTGTLLTAERIEDVCAVFDMALAEARMILDANPG